MKKFIIFLTAVSIISCSKSKNNNPTGAASTKSPLQEKLNSYSVDTTERKELMEYYQKLRKEFDELEYRLLADAEEDRVMFPGYVGQEDKGIIRLVNRDTFTQINGGGGYYSFNDKTHEYGYGSDIQLSAGNFSVGC